MDIAQIGFSANTSELSVAKSKLDQLTPAAGRAERSAAKLAKMMEAGARSATAAARADLMKANATVAAARASDTATRAEINAAQSSQRKARAAYEAAKATQAQVTASRAAAQALHQESEAADQAVNSHNRRRAAANSNAGMLAAQSSPANIAAQFQDIGVTAAMGMNPLLIALQQGTQLSMAFEGGLKGVGAALLMMLSPIAILTIAAVGLGAALLQMVDWTGVAKFALNGLATAIEVLGPYIIGLAATLALIYAPQIIMGIVSVIAWIARMGVAATIAGAKMAAAWIVAMGPVGWMIAGIATVTAAAVIFRDEITRIFGTDIVGSAKEGVNKIIATFVGGYNYVKSTWENLPQLFSAIGKLAYNALVDEISNKPLLTFGDTVLIDGPDMSEWKSELSDAEKKVMEGVNASIGDAHKDYIGNIADATVNGLSTAADKIRSLASGLGAPGEDKKKKAGGGGGGKTDGEKFSDIVNGAERSIAMLEAERAAIGLNEEAAARLKYETQLLNEAKQKNIELSPKQREQLIGLAHDMAALEVETTRAKEALDFAKSATKGFMSDLRAGLEQGKSFWESFGDAALNVLNKIVDKITNDLVDAMFEMNSAGSGGGGGNWLSTAFNFIGGLFRNAKGNAFSKGISGFSNSVVSQPTMFAFASGAGLMGEAGPEAIMPLTRGPDGSLGVQNFGSGSNGGNVSIVNKPVYNIEAGASKETIEEVRKLREEDRRNFHGDVLEVIQEDRKRNGMA